VNAVNAVVPRSTRFFPLICQLLRVEQKEAENWVEWGTTAFTAFTVGDDDIQGRNPLPP
jgi:hypothetical protein